MTNTHAPQFCASRGGSQSGRFLQAVAFHGHSSSGKSGVASPSATAFSQRQDASSDKDIAVFGGGCFWCTEAVFLAIKGVESVRSGYCGGHREHPTYQEVCSGDTGHIEVVKIEFNPAQVSYGTLLEVFFATHDPTTPGRQGNDVGPQYQSAVFYQNEQQQLAAQAFIEQLNGAGHYPAPVCTQLLPAATFWPAEAYHDNYFVRNPGQGYCAFVIAPKVAKFRHHFQSLLRED